MIKLQLPSSCRSLVSGLATLLLTGAAVAQDTPSPVPKPPEFKETAAERDVRMQWFRDAHFGMFIHWGLYSVPTGEWQDKTLTGGAEWI